MRKKTQTDYYKFVENGMALHLKDNELIGQKHLIKALSSEYVKNGKKLESTFDCCDQIYLFNCGDEIIKIGVDKKSLENGDSNALAVDGMCKNAIRVRKVNIRNNIIAGGLSFALVVSMVLGFRYAAKKEADIQREEDHQYISSLDEQRKDKGVSPILSDGSTIDTSDYDDILEHTRGGR